MGTTSPLASDLDHRGVFMVGKRPGSQNLAYDGLALLVPSLLFVNVAIIGRLSLAELALLICLPVLLGGSRHIIQSRAVRTTAVLCVLWLLGQMSTDVLRNTAFSDYARGWANIAFTLVNVLGVVLLLGRSRRRMMLFAAGLAIGGVVGYYFNPSSYAAAEPWKFGVGLPITWVIVLLSTWCYARGSRIQAGLLLVLGAVANMYIGHRSLGGVCVLTALCLIKKPHGGRQRTQVLGQLWLLVMLVGVGWGLLKLYEYVAMTGRLGDRAQQLVAWQAAGELGVLAGGRGALLGALQGIGDSPLLGHGSWIEASDLMSRAADILRRSGYETSSELVVLDLRGALHSHVLGAWVEAGVLGAVFWIWIVVLGGRSLGALHSREEPITPLIAFAGLMLLWDVAFSPYAGQHRVLSPYYIAVLINTTRCPVRSRLDNLGRRIRPVLPVKGAEGG